MGCGNHQYQQCIEVWHVCCGGVVGAKEAVMQSDCQSQERKEKVSTWASFYSLVQVK